MAKIDYNSVYDAVSLILHKIFPLSKIHGRDIEQGLTPGDFNVIPVTPSHTIQMGQRIKRGLLIDVIYYPKENDVKVELLNKANILTMLLTSVTTPEGDILHGTVTEVNFEDNVLHCIVSYSYFAHTLSEKELMSSLSS